MRQRWFGMYLAPLILILIEVILMSHNGEGASASLAERRFKKSSGNVIRVDPSTARHQWRNRLNTNAKIPSRSKNPRINGKKTKPSMDRYLRMKGEPREDSHLTSNQSIPNNQPLCPCKDVLIPSNQVGTGNHHGNVSSTETPLNGKLDSDYSKLNVSSSGTVCIDPNMDETNPNLQPDNSKPKHDSPSSDLQSDSPKPEEDNDLTIPGSVSESNETDSHIQSNDVPILLGVEHFFEVIYDKVASLFSSEEEISNPSDNSTRKQVSRGSFSDVDDKLAQALCQIMTLIINETKPLESIFNLITNIIRWAINLINPFNSSPEEEEAPKPIENLPQPTPKPSDNTTSFLQSIINHVNPFGWFFDRQNSSQVVRQSINYLESALDYFNRSKKIQSNGNLRSRILSVLDLFNAFVPASGNPEFIQSNSTIDRSKTRTHSPFRSLLHSIESYFLSPPPRPLLGPYETRRRSESLGTISDLLTPVQSVIDYLNPFKPATNHRSKTNDRSDDTLTTPIISVLDFFKYFGPTVDDQEAFETDFALSNPTESSISDYIDPFEPETDNLANKELTLQEKSELLESLRPYIDAMQTYIMKLNSAEKPGQSINHWRLSKPNKFVQPMENGGSFFEPNNDVSTLPGSQDSINSLGSNSGPVFSPQVPKYLRRSVREAENCPNVPSDYRQVEGIPRAYIFHNSNLNWNEAQLKCQSEGAELALPEDEAQYDFMIKYAGEMIDGTDLRFHAGLHRSILEKTWTTVLGDPLPFEKWADVEEEDDLTDRNCGGILVSENDINGFTRELCLTQLPFMCEIIISTQCALNMISSGE